MNIFCTQCGAQNPEDAQHCSSCGAALETTVPPAQTPSEQPVAQTPPAHEVEVQPTPVQQTAAQEPSAQPKKFDIVETLQNFRSSKLFLPCVAGAASLVALIVIISVISLLIGGGGKNKPVDRYLDAIASANAEDYLEVFPDAFMEYLEDDDFDMDDLQDDLDSFLEDLEDEVGNKIKVRFEITDEKQLSEKKLNNLKDILNDYYDMPRRDLTEAWELDVDVLFSGSKDDMDDSLTLIVIRYDGKWYICPTHFTDLYYYYY